MKLKLAQHSQTYIVHFQKVLDLYVKFALSLSPYIKTKYFPVVEERKCPAPSTEESAFIPYIHPRTLYRSLFLSIPV